jgi:2'-5' RNA ligase
MKKYAVDVVLLPPENIMTRAIELNRQLTRNNPPKIVLDSDTCVPHISLSMGVLDDSRREAFQSELEKIASEYTPLQLRCEGIYSEDIHAGEKISGIAIEDAKELYELHTDVMKLSNEYLTFDAVAETVYSPPSIEEITLQFINSYREKSAYKNFRPHITLGVGEMDDNNFSLHFTASKLALFHLGTYCTCRKKFFEIRLR